MDINNFRVFVESRFCPCGLWGKPRKGLANVRQCGHWQPANCYQECYSRSSGDTQWRNASARSGAFSDRGDAGSSTDASGNHFTPYQFVFLATSLHENAFRITSLLPGRFHPQNDSDAQLWNLLLCSPASYRTNILNAFDSLLLLGVGSWEPGVEVDFVFDGNNREYDSLKIHF